MFIYNKNSRKCGAISCVIFNKRLKRNEIHSEWNGGTIKSLKFYISFISKIFSLKSSTTELESLKQQISNLLLEQEQQLNLNKQTLDKLEEEKNGQIEELRGELNEAMERIGELEKDKIMRGNIDQVFFLILWKVF